MKLIKISQETLKKIFPDEETFKCGACNWSASAFYLLMENSKTQKIKHTLHEIIKNGEFPLCGECMTELLAEEKYEILTN